MTSTTREFTVQGKWTGGREGSGRLDAKGLSSEVSVPDVLGGPGIGTNPEELIVGAAANCFLITFAIVLQRAGLSYHEIRVESKGTVVFDGRLTLVKIHHDAEIRCSKAALSEHQADFERLAHEAEERCMVSRAMAGNVPVEVAVRVIATEGLQHAG